MLKSYFGRLGGAFLNSRRGATAIEYGILAALVAAVIAVGATSLGAAVDSELDAVTTVVSG
jgi:Flp pilus assembly pilin Flp